MSGPLSEIPPVFWMWGALTLLLTAAAGYVAGVLTVRSAEKWTVRRAERCLTKYVAALLKSLESVRQTCTVLEQAQHLQLSVEQIDRLDESRNRLLDTISGLLERHRERQIDRTDAKAAKQAAKRRTKADCYTWERNPEDPQTGLPDRSAMDANLALLLQTAAEQEHTSALLLVQVDRFDHLNSRFGAEGATAFLKEMCRVVLRSSRDDDVVCRLHGPTFAVLMPDVDPETAVAQVESIRNTVRQYRFRRDGSGPEVLVTASFGLAVCPPGDQPELALNRAESAVAGAQRRGRNRLQVCHESAAQLASAG